MTEASEPITGSENSLRHALSLHPRAFHVASSTHRENSQQRDPIPTPPANDAHGIVAAHTTAYEPTTPDSENNDPIARSASRAFDEDVERQSLPRYTRESDPYQLSSKLKSPSEIDLIKANTSKKRDGWSRIGCLEPLSKGKGAWRARKVQGFYKSQNDTIQQLLKPVDDHRQEAKDVYGENQVKYKVAVRGSFLANVLLAGLQLYAAASSVSLSLFTTMADALFDPLSNVTLILSNRAVNRVDPRKFPSGKARIETAGNIVFCFLMTSVSFIIVVQSIEEIARGSPEDTKAFHPPSIIAVAFAFATKLGLFIYCWTLRHLFSQIRILWEDHRNDLLINGFGLLTSVGGSKLKWWVDPMGAIILSCLIALLWLRTAYSEFQLLIGVSAETQMLQLITYICKLIVCSNLCTLPADRDKQ
jgi:divalent metal cation (Fe/Co/Zn/Cd) transporter